MKKTTQHDKRYKKLFSHPTLLRELLESFVHEDFIHELDFSTLERIDKSFVTDNFAEKESDLIYKINFKSQEIYIYLLIEFQSKVDRFMALRILRYLCEFYEFLIQQKIKKLPAVFPVLLYNGDARWTAPCNIKELIDHVIPEQYIPDFSYYPVLENELSKETLLQITNAVSAVFYIENSSVEEARKNIIKIIKLLMTESPEVVTLFKNWLNDLLGFKDAEIIESLDELEETHEMFATALKKHDEELRRKSEQQGIKKGVKKGVKKGIEKGIQKGIKEGKIEAARKMKEKGFRNQDIIEITGLSEDILIQAGIE